VRYDGEVMKRCCDVEVVTYAYLNTTTPQHHISTSYLNTSTPQHLNISTSYLNTST
jgi:hypothetical protein